MLETIIKKGTYQDSVVLMLLTNELSAMDGVNKVSVMMGTPANKDIFKSGGLYTEKVEEASANDMVIVIDAENENVIEEALNKVDSFIMEQSKGSSGSDVEKEIKTWEQALDEMPEANMALISVPGMYAASVADRALDEGLNAFVFSDNVSIEDELALKEKAEDKGLLVMGPDSGTGIINGVPIAFANKVRKGSIGLVGASGTGIQEVTCLIDRLGSGVVNAIGTGGRDLSEKIMAKTMLKSLATLNSDDRVKVITVISKPPAEKVANKVINYLRSIEKPAVIVFMGEEERDHEEGLYYAYTLEEAARISVALANGEEIPKMKNRAELERHQGNIKAYYSGGTLAEEAAMIIKDTLGLEDENEDGYIYKSSGFEVLDLGDDKYTQGKPHPMIDPTTRVEYMKNSLEDEETKVILFDIVLGYGSHENMAKAISNGIESVKAEAEKLNREIFFVASITGTDKDRQVYEEQKEILLSLGVEVLPTNNQAVERALALIGKEVEYLDKKINPKVSPENIEDIELSESVTDLFVNGPRVINIGLQSFTETIKEFTDDVVQYNWQPVAGGDIKLIKILDFLREYEF